MESSVRWSVGPESVRMIELGHPWIIADSYTKRWPTGKPGEIVSLCDTNGKFLATALLDPQDRIVARILSLKKVQLNREWLTKRIQAAIRIRKNHIVLGETSAYRLINGEGDRLPGLTVDCYAGYLMLQVYCSGWQAHLKLVTQVLQELLEPVGIYEKSRPQKTRELEAAGDSKSYGRLLYGKPAPNLLEVRENGLTFLVSLEKGLNTGLFLDQRRNRLDLMARARKKRVLNLFAYTGAFSVAAATSGAQQVTSVDASPGYTDWARANFAANRLDPKKYEFIVGDCLKVLVDLVRQKRTYDIILMDPPSFSTTAKSRFTTRGGTSEIVAASLPLLANGGLMITSSNHQKIDVAEYLKEVRRGTLQSGNDLQVISLFSQPEDFPYPVTFPEGRYLKYAVCVKSEM